MTAGERAEPATVGELSELLARCDASGRAVVLAGGNTLHGMGFAPARTGLTLQTGGLAGTIAYEPDDLTIALAAGSTVRAVANELAAHRQFVPFDAPHPAKATVGGTLAAGWLGPRRHRYGRPRDLLLGSTVVLADGTVARAGGMTVKNVAGYDMSRLYVGSFGTLAAIARANFKTLVLPERARVFLARLPEGSRSRAVGQLRALAVEPSAALWIEGFHQTIDGDDGDEGRLLVMLECAGALLERATRDLRSALGRAGVPQTQVLDAGARESLERAIDAYVATLGERSVTYRIYALPEAAEGIASSLLELTRSFELRCERIVNVLNGDVVLRASDLDARALGSKIERFDDALHAWHPRAIVIASEHPRRSDLRVWGEPPAAIEKMRALKARFDPNGTLNPGRFAGGI